MMAEGQVQAQESALTSPSLSFPSLAWFERLAALMKAQRALHERLGYMDCKVRFTVLDGSQDGSPWSVQIHFDEFDALDVVQLGAASGKAEAPDFSMEATLETWRRMIESIAAGGGRPGLQQTLNDLNLRSNALRITSDDTLLRDLFFRYNQSLQAFINASGSFLTVFPGAD